MNITISSLYFYPELTGIGVYSHGFAKYLAEKGHKVKVFTTFPFYPEWKKSKDYRKKLFCREFISGIDVFRLYTYVPHNPGTISRIIHEMIFSIILFGRLLFIQKCNLIICISPPFFSMVITAIISRLKSIPLMIHIQDLQPDAAIALGMIKNENMIRLLRRFEMFSYNTASIISSIGKGMNENISEKGVKDSKLLLFSNWTDYQEILQFSCDPMIFRKKYNLENEFIVLHSGNMGEKHGLLTLIKTAMLAQNKNENIKFIISGDGVQKQYLIRAAERFNLKNVIFLSVQPKREFYNMLASANISVVLLKKEVRDIAIPSRLLNILAVGCPLIASVNAESETAKFLHSLPLEVTVPPEDPEALLNKILQYKNKFVDTDVLRCSEKLLAKKFSGEIILPQVLTEVESKFESGVKNTSKGRYVEV